MELENGGLEAMLHDLLELDLDGWHPRNIIRTEALREQQLRSLSAETKWWLELLETGTLQGADAKDPSCARSDSLFKQARESSPQLKYKSDQVLARELVKRGCTNTRISGNARGWQFPPLLKARAAWEVQFPGHQWRDPTLTEWQLPPEVQAYNEQMDRVSFRD